MSSNLWDKKTITTWNPRTLPVKYGELDDWESFLFRWKRLKLKTDAISYMHQLVNLADKKDNFGNPLVPLKALLNFFLFYSEKAEDAPVKEKAQQLLVSQVLTRINYHRGNDLDDDQFIYMFRQIFLLLSSRLGGIRDRPFPGYVLKFLLDFQELWSCTDHDNPQYGYRLRILSQELTQEFVNAMLTWCAGHHLFVSYDEDDLDKTKELECIIHKFLVDNHWLRNMCLEYIPSIHSTSSDTLKNHRVNLPYYVEPNLRDLKDKQLASASAYLALLRVQDVLKHYGCEPIC